MKKGAIAVIWVYTSLVSPALHQVLGIKSACRYEITCSRYAAQVIEKYGIFKGSVRALRRLINCQPVFKI